MKMSNTAMNKRAINHHYCNAVTHEIHPTHLISEDTHLERVHPLSTFVEVIHQMHLVVVLLFEERMDAGYRYNTILEEDSWWVGVIGVAKYSQIS